MNTSLYPPLCLPESSPSIHRQHQQFSPLQSHPPQSHPLQSQPPQSQEQSPVAHASHGKQIQFQLKLANGTTSISYIFPRTVKHPPSTAHPPQSQLGAPPPV